MISLPVWLSGPMSFPGWVYDVTSCLAAWSHASSVECLPTRGCLPTKGLPAREYDTPAGERSQNTVLLAYTQAVYKPPHSTV